MSIQSISAASTTTSTEEQSIGCWQRFTEGLGWVVSKVVWFIGVLGRIILWPFQIISCLVFKALGVVWPEMAARAEVLWNQLLLMGERVVTAAREEELLNEIGQLQAENQNLREMVDAQGARMEEFRHKDNHQIWELGVFQEERDAARRERDQRLEGRTRLTLERDQLREDKERLERELNEATLAKDTATRDKEQQQTRLNQAFQEIEVMKEQLEQGNRNGELLEQFRKIDTVYERKKLEQEGGEINATELELQQLIPIYEAQKEVYKQMIQQVLNEMPIDHELQIPLQGILRLFNEEVGHLKRISEEMHFYAELKGPLNCFRKVIT